MTAALASPNNRYLTGDDRSDFVAIARGATGGRASARSSVRVRRRASVETYRRRRAVVGSLLAVITACGLVLTHDVLASSSGEPASAASSSPAPTRTTVTAQPGDTLWSIAEQYAGDISITRYLDKLVDLNGGPSIQAGQQVLLP